MCEMENVQSLQQVSRAGDIQKAADRPVITGLPAAAWHMRIILHERNRTAFSDKPLNECIEATDDVFIAHDQCFVTFHKFVIRTG